MGDLIVKGSDKEMSEQIPAGNYQGVCYQVLDLGTHHVDFNWEGKHVVGDYHKVQVTWEIPSERIEIVRDDQPLDLPRVISKEYNLTLGKKANLRKDLESWRGCSFTTKELDGFNLIQVLKANAQINILHNDKGYANVAAVTPLMKGMPKLEAENPIVSFSIENDGFDNLPELPEWIENKIKESLEYQEYCGKGAPRENKFVNADGSKYDEMNPPPPDDDSDTIPF